MKKIVIVLFSLFIGLILSTNTANAQFTGGDTSTSSGKSELVMSWDMFNKSISLTDDGYIFTYIFQAPRKTPEGKTISAILTLSLGKTRDECVSTLNAYKNLYNAMEKNEFREITDVTSGITYTITKNVDGILNGITFNGGLTENGLVIVEHSGILTMKDVDKMLKKLK